MGRFHLRGTLRFALFLFFACAALAVFSNFAHAQRFDVAAGLSGIDAPGTGVADGIHHQPQSLTGGAYLVFSGDFLFYHKTIGVQGEFVRRETQGFDVVNNLPDRPMFIDVNAIWTKKFFRRFTAELEGGMGAEVARFYTGGCGSSSNCYVDKNHLMADAGAGIKIYPLRTFIFRHIFLRPEGRFYFVRNNQEFSSARAIRYGASIGYTF